jgi:hypothetical protein
VVDFNQLSKKKEIMTRKGNILSAIPPAWRRLDIIAYATGLSLVLKPIPGVSDVSMLVLSLLAGLLVHIGVSSMPRKSV